MERVDRARFPKVANYLAALPAGLSSYPGSQIKASVLRASLRTLVLPKNFTGCPAVLESLLRNPPPVSKWIAAVHFQAAVFAASDSLGLDRQAHLDWVYRSNRRLFATPLYRVMMYVASPTFLLNGAVSRWNRFHIAHWSPRRCRFERHWS